MTTAELIERLRNPNVVLRQSRRDEIADALEAAKRENEALAERNRLLVEDQFNIREAFKAENEKRAVRDRGEIERLTLNLREREILTEAQAVALSQSQRENARLRDALSYLVDASELAWDNDYPYGQYPLSVARADLATDQKGGDT